MSKDPLSFAAFVVAVLLVTSPAFAGSLEVDQSLLKVLVKEGDSFSKSFTVTNAGSGTGSVQVSLEGPVLSAATLSAGSFSLNAGESKTLTLSLTGSRPDVYVGRVVIRSGSEAIEIPLVLEVETKEVLFDSNVDFNGGAAIPGGRINVHLAVFNLVNALPTSVKASYSIKDLSGTDVVTESESLVVATEARYTKSISLPNNLKDGTYVYSAVFNYGNSVGTSTLVFSVGRSVITQDAVALCIVNSSCMFGAFAIVVVILFMSAILYMAKLISQGPVYRTPVKPSIIGKQITLKPPKTKGGWFELEKLTPRSFAPTVPSPIQPYKPTPKLAPQKLESIIPLEKIMPEIPKIIPSKVPSVKITVPKPAKAVPIYVTPSLVPGIAVRKAPAAKPFRSMREESMPTLAPSYTTPSLKSTIIKPERTKVVAKPTSLMSVAPLKITHPKVYSTPSLVPSLPKRVVGRVVAKPQQKMEKRKAVSKLYVTPSLVSSLPKVSPRKAMIKARPQIAPKKKASAEIYATPSLLSSLQRKPRMMQREMEEHEEDEEEDRKEEKDSSPTPGLKSRW
ncbi:MAG TPA: hypothetical protein VJH90_03950 [archaeon]|nr:hypothetical protein [archaeon]